MTTHSRPIDTSQVSRRTKHFIPPPISFVRPKNKELKKNEQLTVTLRSNPADATSQTYQITCPFFGIGTPQEWFDVQKTIHRILVGQNITTGPPSYAMTRRLLETDALAVFNQKANDLGNETIQNFNLSLQVVTMHVLPTRALQNQRRFIRRHLRKPRDVSIRNFNSRLQEINAYLPLFPPFGNNQKLADNDLLKVLEFAIPNSWQNQMVLQGFTPSDHSILELVEFGERLEFIEKMTPVNNHNGNNKGKNFQTSQKGGSKKDHKRGGKPSDEAPKPDRAGKRQRTDKYCPLHDTDTHDMSECKVMLDQAKKMRDSYSNSGSGFQKQSSTHKKKELNAFIESSIKTGIQKALKRRRKSLLTLLLKSWILSMPLTISAISKLILMTNPMNPLTFEKRQVLPMITVVTI